MRKGFTLLELLIVVIIIGVLAAVAVPQYMKAVERAKVSKAKTALGLIAQGQKMYRGENDTYVPVADGEFDNTLGDYVELTQVDTDDDWDYDVSGDEDTFTATATRTGGPGTYNGTTITLTDDGTCSGGHGLRGPDCTQ